MTKNQSDNKLGERLQPTLRQPASNLAAAANGRAPGPHLMKKKAMPNTATANFLAHLASVAACKPGSCWQTIWFSFFFDGTGNNMNYDMSNGKHSNVAKLYRAHAGDEYVGGVKRADSISQPSTYRIYIPGVGTYFPAVGDPGGRKDGLGAGAFGQARLNWALAQFDAYMASHLALAKNPANKIVEINIAIFGFSRGAAAARAFVHDFIDSKCTKVARGAPTAGEAIGTIYQFANIDNFYMRLESTSLSRGKNTILDRVEENRSLLEEADGKIFRKAKRRVAGMNGYELAYSVLTDEDATRGRVKVDEFVFELNSAEGSKRKPRLRVEVSNGEPPSYPSNADDGSEPAAAIAPLKPAPLATVAVERIWDKIIPTIRVRPNAF